MNKSTFPTWLRPALLAHWIVGLVTGVPLLLAPGRTAVLIGWVPETVTVTVSGTEVSTPGYSFIDPVIARTLGAAMLALAFASYLVWRKPQADELRLLVRIEAVFCIGAIAGFLAKLAPGRLPLPVAGWVMLAILVIFAGVWVMLWRSESRSA
jgi:uncharacterized membrane protein YfcA